jgi:hypothetical protein
LIKSSPTQHVAKRSDLGNEAAQILISINHALAAPPIVNDIAASMPGYYYLFQFHYILVTNQ